MSMQFTADSTGEWAFTRWCHNRAAAFDFGARMEAAMECMEAAQAGESFSGEDGTRWTGEEFRTEAFSREWTFGEFCGTFEAGSADHFRALGNA